MKLLLTLLALIPLTLFCQNTATPKKVDISIGVTFSPDYCYRTLVTQGGEKWIAESRDTFEIPKFGYTTGLNFAVKFNKRFSLETGLLYSNKGEKTKKLTDLHSLLPDSIASKMPIAISYIYRYIYLDIPFKVNYYILTKRTKLYVMAGISPNILLTQQTASVIEFKDGRKETNRSHESGYLLVDLTFITGLGFSYDVSHKLSFRLEPTYRRSITPIDDFIIRSYLYSIGLTTGLYYKL